MSKSCAVQFNQTAGRWEAIFAGKVLSSSTDVVGGKDYIIRVIEGGFSKKARVHSVTKCQIIESQITPSAGIETSAPVAVEVCAVEKEFLINERFQIMEDYVDMVAARSLASTIVTGEGGLGKTYTVMKALRNSGLKDITKMDIGAKFDGQRGYVVVKGYSTPKGLFRTLYENRNQIIVFDDCDSVLRDPVAVNILKAALDSYEERVVTWNAESWSNSEDLQKSFEFTGGVIFISNMPKAKVPQAIRSRAMCADVGMTRDEVIERMQVIVNSEEFMPEFDAEMKEEALQFVTEHAYHPLITELNLRSLVNVIKARAAKPDSWKRLGLYSMANG